MSTPLIGILILAVITLLLLIMIIRLELRFKRLFIGTKAKDLEEAIGIIGTHIKQVGETQKEINAHLEIVDGKLKKTIRNIETVRFNPFPDAGSNQSFAIAMLNDEGNGVVLSSLYARDRMSIFAKPVTNHTSDHELTEEESTVLAKAK